MPYLHGVYTSESPTSVVPTVDAASCLPFVIGRAPSNYGGELNQVVRCSTWQEFKTTFSADDSCEGEDSSTLATFARQWYKRAGASDALFYPVDSGEQLAGEISLALAALDTVYEQFGLVVTVVLCPRIGKDYATEIAAKVQKFGSGWSAIALIDLPYTWSDGTPTLPLKSSYLVYCSPRCQAGSEIVDASCVVAGAMAATDASAGGFPYVSPSNKLAYIDGVVDESGDPLFLSQPDVNDLFNANAVVSFLHNAKGWVVWGNNTGFYSPSATDPKDRWISVRRTFCYIRNDFLVFGASRIDNPINKRQLDGVVNAYNQRLKGLVGVGAVNSAAIALSDRNTAETLLGGAVFVDVRISPPPPMENLDATFEYDVEGFVSSLS